MFISVDLPAPFSPSRACTSPGRRSKSIPSLATTPGKRFVIDRSSRIGPSLIRRPFYGGTRGADRVSPPLSACRGGYFAGGTILPAAVSLLIALTLFIIAAPVFR